MKISYCASFGALATITYSFVILIKGSIDMTKTGNIARTAQSILDDANSKWNIANQAYLASQNSLTYAEQTIENAHCFINSYPNFAATLAAYCAPLSQTTNALTKLSQTYGIELVTVPDVTYYATGIASYLNCYEVADGQTYDFYGNCKTKYRTKCDTIPYYYPQTTYELHGATVQGAGSQISMNCGRFTHSITTSASQYVSSDTGMLIDSYIYNYMIGKSLIGSAKRIIKHTSKIDVNVNIDSATASNPSSMILDPSTTNLAAAANSIAALIFSQCNLLNNSIRAPSHYQELINTTILTLPNLHAEIDRTTKILDAAAAVKNQKQAAFDTVDAAYREQLSIWLPQLFLALPILILSTCLLEQYNREKNFDNVKTCDTNDPFACCFGLFKHRNRAKFVPTENVEQESYEQTSPQPPTENNDDFVIDPESRIPVAQPQLKEDYSARTLNSIPVATIAQI